MKFSVGDKVVDNICNPTNQFACNSCWAISICQVMSDKLRNMNIIPKNDELNYYLFHDYLVNVKGRSMASCQTGATFMLGFDESVNTGAPLMSKTKDREFDEKIISSDMDQKLYTVKRWDTIIGDTNNETNNNIIKALDSNTTVITVINIYPSIYKFKGVGVYNAGSNEYTNDGLMHMLSIVGYNLKERTFILRNSYGNSFGNQGFFKVSFDDERLDYDLNCYIPVI